MSPNALRLLGKIHRNVCAISLELLVYESKKQFDPERAEDTAQELVFLGYLIKTEGGWARTEKPYTTELRRKLAALAQRRAKLKEDIGVPVNRVDPDMDPGVAYWFGYPLTLVYLTGRVHLLEEQ